MRVSFAWKLSLSIATLTFLVTGISLGFLFFQARAMTIGQLQDRLKELSAAGTLYFDDDQRETLRDLARLVRARAASLNPEEKERIAALSSEESFELLPGPQSTALMKGAKFQAIVQSLRKIREATRPEIAPPGKVPSYHTLPPGDQPLIQYAYLFITLPDFPDKQIMAYIGDSDYAPIDQNGDGDYLDADDFPGNPVGNLFRPTNLEMVQAFQGQLLAEEEENTDKWGTWLSGFAPIKDRDGTIIAVLGVDFSVTNQKNQVRRLGWFSIAMMTIALVLSILLGIVQARLLSQPLAHLRAGAERVAARDFDTRIEVSSRDELGQLATAFNSMVIQIKSYASELRDVQQVRAVLEHSDRLKSEIIAKINHELQMPLLGVLANMDFIEAALSQGETEKARELVKKSKNYCLYQRTLVNNMIYAAVENVRDPFIVDREDLADFLVSLEQSVALVRDVHNGELEFQGPVPEVFIPCQQEILMVILVNILSNCCEHAGGTFVRCQLRGDRLVLITESTVRVPVDPAVVFEKWESSSSRKIRPILGLGMNIVRSLVEKVGGGVVAYNRDELFLVEIGLPVAHST